ncbi:MAG: type II toxin-antitoxin system prevent-host-death family antitoxin [Desulfobulbaceae bacterium]|nr:type II toxin-antitoxin system prevent-host-death family antitoxin [Desulfobulbaceae bacterium]
MIETVAISKFKATCLAQIDSVNKTGQPLIITRRGEPIAQILPPPVAKKKKSWLGSFRKLGSIKGDIVSPATNIASWEVLHDETTS